MAFEICQLLSRNPSSLRIHITFPSFRHCHSHLSASNPIFSFSRCCLHQPLQDTESSSSLSPIHFSIPADRAARHSDPTQKDWIKARLAQGPREFLGDVANRKVAVFWDLDNKAPRREAYEVAMEVRTVAEAFGEVIQMEAYANQHVFNFVPMYEREARQKREELDKLELEGIVKPPQPYICKICREKFPIHVELRNHLLTFHEKGRVRVARLLGSNELTSEERAKLERRRRRYMEGIRKVVYPEVGYNLDYELQRAGVEVGLVSDDPQAADAALKSCMLKTLEEKDADCLFLVSDDTDYEAVLLAAGNKGLQRVVVGETSSLKQSADVWLSWFELNNGDARIAAMEASEVYLSKLRQRELEKDKLDQKIRRSSFERIWRRDSVIIKREGKCLVQAQHSPTYTFSGKDLLQQVGSN